jgi:hypothetical protein
MRIFRIAVATTLISIASSVIMLTASAAQAAPFTYSSVNVGFRNACATTSDGQLLCWGENADRQLSTTRTDRYLNSPVIMSMPEPIASVDTSYGYTLCALGVSGRAYCWGNGGHLGSYLTTTSTAPVRVEFPNDMRVSNLQNGGSNACALDSSRAIWCWGDPLTLGDGNVDSVRVPVKLTMPDNSPIAQYDMGLSDTCVVTDQGNMFCWGPVVTTRYWWSTTGYLPVQINAPTGTTWASAQVEGGRVCGITTNGNGYCLGDNYNGNFGNGSYDDSQTMTRMIVPNNELVQSIHMGSYATCIVTTINNIWCVGEGGNGQLGTGTTLGGRTWRQPVFPAGVTLSRLSMNHTGTCGLDTANRIWCWSYIANYDVSSGLVYNNLLPILRPQVGTPEITTPVLSNITTSSVDVSASASPFGFVTSGSIEYSTDSSFASSTLIEVPGRSANDSFATLPFSTRINALSPRTTYFVRAIARSAAGESMSATNSFLTLGSEPTILDVSTSQVTGNEATVTAEIDPGFLATNVSVLVSESTSFTNTTTSISMGSLNGDSVAHPSAALSNLSPQRTYYLRVVATNVLGTTQSQTTSLRTVGESPSISSINGSSTNSSISAMVNIATGRTRGTITYQVSRAPSFAVISDTQSSSYSSSGPLSFSFRTDRLPIATDYWIRTLVTNEIGTVTSDVISVRTKGSAPVIGTLSAEPILQGVVVSFPLDTTGISTMAVVDIANNGDMKNYTSHFAYSGATNGTQTVSLTIPRLSPTVEYFARVSAINSLGQTVSNIVSFRTIRPLGLVINDDEVSTTNPHITLNFRYPSDTVAIRVSNNADFSGARIFSPTPLIPWDLITSEEEESLRTVYVQFITARGVATLYTDEITLDTDVSIPDEEAPIITSLRSVTAQSLSLSGITSSAAGKNMRRFVVAVSDKVTGVTRIQTKVGARIITQKVDALRLGEYSLAFARTVKSFSIRVIDRSGNASKWKKISVR